jgi:hypothetical protein
MDIPKDMLNDPEYKGIESKEINFDLGKIGLYVIKLEAMLNTLMYNQAKVLAHLQGGDVDKIFEGMKEGEKKLVIDTFNNLHVAWDSK